MSSIPSHPQPAAAPRITRGAALRGVLQALLAVAYPLVIYLAHGRIGVRGTAALLLVLLAMTLVVRGGSDKTDRAALIRSYLPLVLLVAAAFATGEAIVLLWLPMFASLYVFATFAWTLYRPPSMIERFARAIEDDLPPFTFAYCRKITLTWCVFLATNALVVGALAWRASLGWWTLYTGLLFYIGVGALLAGEFVLRKIWFRHYAGAFGDRLFARWFPAERSANGRRSLAYARARSAAQSESASPQ